MTAFLAAAASCVAASPPAVPSSDPSVRANVSGDVDGNGIVDLEDARLIVRFVLGRVASLPHTENADATQDGVITIDDALAIAQSVTGLSKVVVAGPENGIPGDAAVGSLVRIEVFERFLPLGITDGTVTIHSDAAGYDSGVLRLSLSPDRRSLYRLWSTGGLTPASDYEIHASLSRSSSPRRPPPRRPPQEREPASALDRPDAMLALVAPVYEIPYLAEAEDAFAPAPGLDLVFRRVLPQHHLTSPYLGPLGRGWMHNFDVHLIEYTDGHVAFLGETGYNRWFVGHPDGTYTPSPGDHATLSRGLDGTFALHEPTGLTRHFRQDLQLDYVEEPKGNRIEAIYDTKNRLTEVRHMTTGQHLQLEYNERGRISGLINHVGGITRYTYDPSGQHLIAVMTPDNLVAYYTYSLGQAQAVDHRLLSITLSCGTHLYYTYDSEGRILTQEGDDGLGRTQYSYASDGTTSLTSASGLVSSVRVNEWLQATEEVDPSGAVVSYQYDPQTNLIRSTHPLNRVYRYVYDARGNVVQVIDPLGNQQSFDYDPGVNKIVRWRDALSKSTVFSYDGLGNLLGIIYADGSSGSFAYDGANRLVQSTDANGRSLRFSYNSQDQLTSMQDALGHGPQLFYNAAGDLNAITDPRGYSAVYTHNDVGQLVKREYPDRTNVALEYEPGGRLSAFINARGQRMLFSYECPGLPQSVLYPSGKGRQFHYDAERYLVGVDEHQGGTTVQSVSYQRDVVYRVTRERTTHQDMATSYTISYSYDPAGNRVQMIYPDGYALAYTYDDANRLRSIADTATTIVSYEYDAEGRRMRRDLGNGTYSTYIYDAVDQLTQLINYAPNGQVQSEYTYTYDAAGMRASLTTSEGAQTYAYDDAYRLIRVTYPDGRNVSYSFDESGNRTSVADNGVLSHYATNLVDEYTQVDSEAFTYDLDGNLQLRTLGADQTGYTWDEENHLASVSRGGVTIDYRYDHLGRLTGKTAGSHKMLYVWDGEKVIAEVDSSGQVLKRYIYGATMDELVLASTGNARAWVVQDGLGSYVGTTDDLGAMRATASYDIYGNLRWGSLGSVPQSFAGMWYDADAGLYYARARWYEPILGRFISRDPTGPPGVANLYTYANNRPVLERDPRGLWSPDSEFWKRFHSTPWWDWPINWVGARWGLNYCGRNISGGGWADPGVLGPTNAPAVNWVDRECRQHDIDYWRAEHNLSPGWQRLLGGGVLWANLNVFGRFGRQLLARSVYGDLVDNWGWGGWSGGTCPTFVQLGADLGNSALRPTHLDITSEPLAAKITVPVADALLRGDVPVFGVAGGANFKNYRVEYGLGKNPTEWRAIESSSMPQPVTNVGLAETRLMQGDIDIRGNLATWNVGLKNWVHLPWHPPEDTTDLNGIYTLRLLVEGRDGSTVEDRVSCEVGRAIAQCRPGLAISSDGRVLMRFPEQSLTHPFRVYTIIPTSESGEEAPTAPVGCQHVGSVYRIREPGDRFAKDVALEFLVDSAQLAGGKSTRMGIARYAVEKGQWFWLPTRYAVAPSGTVFRTALAELPQPQAIYGLILDSKRTRSHADAEREEVAADPTVRQPRAGLLVEDTFERELGGWKPRDRFVGATLARNNMVTADGSYALEVSNTNPGGNLSVTVLERPFDVLQFPMMSFDYRVRPGVKTDFYLLVGGRWYNLGFTDDPMDFRNRGLNIGNMGRLDGILSDDRWHSATANLAELLRERTRQRRVEAIIMADWNVGGYMKLDLGNNLRGATYYIDNFRIASRPRPEAPTTLVVDTFDSGGERNLLGGLNGLYSDPGAVRGGSRRVEDPSNPRAGRVLQLDFDVTAKDAYCGYWTLLEKCQAGEMAELALRLWADGDVPPLLLGLHRAAGEADFKISVRPYASPADERGWRSIRVPLEAFYGAGLPRNAPLGVLSLSFANGIGSGKGTVFVDDVEFVRARHYGKVVDCSLSTEQRNLLGGEYRSVATGAASISWGFQEDERQERLSVGRILRISYGGNIGLDYGNGRFSYAVWETDLRGLDARGFTTLVLRVRGENGGEKPNIYLGDGADCRPVRAREVPPITTSWQEIRIPLEMYASQGIDLSKVERLQIVFEWAAMSGTLYIDGIVFQTNPGSTETALNALGGDGR